MRRTLLWIGRFALITVVLGAAVGYWVANRYYNDKALARRLSKGFNKTHRGRLHLGRVHWKPSAILKLLKNDYDEVTVTDVRIYDSRGRLALHIPKAEGKIRLWDIILRGDFFLKYLRFKKATIYLQRYLRPDGPNKQGERYEIGLLGAFEIKKSQEKAAEAAQKKRAKAARQSFIVVDKFDVSGVDIHADLGDVGFRLDQAMLAGSLYYASAAGNKRSTLHYDLKPRVESGSLRLGSEELSLAQLIVKRLAATRKHPDRIVVDAGVRVANAEVTMRGGLTGLGDADGPNLTLRVAANRFGGLLARLAKRDVVDEGSRLRMYLSGPLNDPAADIAVAGLGLRHDRIRVQGVELAARYETGVLQASQLNAIVLGGTLHARAWLHADSRRWRATLEAKNLKTRKLLGPDHALAGRITGWMDASGALDDPSRGWTRFEATLTRPGWTGALPPSIKASGILHASPERLDVRQLALNSDVLDLDTNGRFWPHKLEMDLALKAQARRLRSFLMRLGKPPVVAALAMAGRLRGRVFNPRFAGQATVGGIRQSGVEIRTANAAVGLQSGNLSARNIRGNIYGGRLWGRAGVALYKGDLRRWRRVPRFWVRGGVNELDVARPTRGAVEALVTGRFNFRGTTLRYTGQASARSRLLWAADQWYRDARVAVTVNPRATLIDSLYVRREEGGSLGFTGTIRRTGKLDGRIAVRDLPLSVVPGLSGEKPPAAGLINTRDLRLLGTTSAPVLEGAVELVKATLRGVAVGPGLVKLTAAGDVTRLAGSLPPGFRLTRGRLDLGKRRVDLQLRFDNVELERFVPELARKQDVEGRVSGTLDLKLGTPGGIQDATLRVERLALTLRKPEDPFTGHQEVAVIRNQGTIELHYDGKKLRVKHLVLSDRDDIHRLRVTGHVSALRTALRLKGRLNLLPMEILAGEQLDRLRGVAGVDLRVTGSPRKPRISGTIYPAGIVIRPRDFDGDVIIRAGQIHVTNERLDLRHLRVAIADEETDLTGRIALKDFRPQSMNLRVRGLLSAQALEIALGDTISRARGEPSQVDLRIAGPMEKLEVQGALRLGRVSLTLRGLGKDISLRRGGRVSFNRNFVQIQEVRGTLDDGPFVLSGDVFLDGLAVSGLRLHFVGDNIPYRSSGTYEVELSPDVTLTGSADPQVGYTLAGVVDVAEGRYFQKFSINPVQRILSPTRVVETSDPFWEDSPFLQNLKLNLTISTSGTLRVKNNLADIGLDGDLSVKGTLPAPLIGGTVDFKEGNFRIPFLRGRYTVSSGVIDFDKGRTENIDDPWIRLVGSTEYTDRSDNEHEITLTVEGYLSRLVPRWSSNTGLNSSQILALLVTGRTPDDLRKGRGGSIPNLAPLIEEYLPVDLQLDLSSDSVQVYVEKKLGRHFKLKGEVEMGYVGKQRQEGMIIFKILDQLSLVGRARRRIQGEDVTVEEDILSGRIEARYKIRLRGTIRRALGF